MKNKKIFRIIIILLLLCALAFVAYKGFNFVMSKYHNLVASINTIEKQVEENRTHYDMEYEWVNKSSLVAHAFGGKGTKTYTNALEAFNYNYDLGHRIFEVDFDLTEDMVTICSHDEDYWRYITNNENNDSKYDYETFKSTPLFIDYTPLDYKDIINLLNEYPDIYIITDTKYSDEIKVYQQFSQLVDYAKEVNPEVLDRLIPQIYTKEMLGYVKDVYDFKSIIFTLYQITWEKEDIASFCIKSGIKFITVSADLVREEIDVVKFFKSMNLHVAVHTVNEVEDAKYFIDNGVDLIYTDFLLPEEFVKE